MYIIHFKAHLAFGQIYFGYLPIATEGTATLP